jgi:hypothetical protein
MTSPLEQCRDALKPCPFCGSPADVQNDFGREFWAQCTNLDCGASDGSIHDTPGSALAYWNRRPAAEAALQQESATFSAATILPDGSAFATASWPLPKDHWLYAPRGEWDSVRDEYSECPAPILNNSHAQAVRAAVKYAVRGATMCGQDMDFDPDAMVQNSVYALCGPANAAVLPVDAQGEPVAWAQLGMRNGHTYVRMHYEGHLYPPPPDVQRNLNLVPLYVAPVAAPVAQGWQPIETAPADMAQPVVVRWVDSEGEEARKFDYKEDGCWTDWHDYAENVKMIGGHGVSETPPYEHWMPLPAAPKEPA